MGVSGGGGPPGLGLLVLVGVDGGLPAETGDTGSVLSLVVGEGWLGWVPAGSE